MIKLEHLCTAQLPFDQVGWSYDMTEVDIPFWGYVGARITTCCPEFVRNTGTVRTLFRFERWRR